MASEAKETIKSAFAGLLLALLSWVIVSTINPDVLYIKQPGSKMIPVTSQVCTTGANNANPCICKNGNSIPNPGGTNNCEDVCEYNCVPQKTTSCYLGSATPDGNGMCGCVDGTRVKAVNPGTPCQTVCSVNAQAGDGKHHCLVARVKVGAIQNDAGPYTTESEFKKVAIFEGKDVNSAFTAVQNQRVVVNLEDYSIGYNLPLRYFVDGRGDGECIPGNPNDQELANPITGFADGWTTMISYLTIPAVPACQHSQVPKAEHCIVRFCIQDSALNVAHDEIYWDILDDPNVLPNIP